MTSPKSAVPVPRAVALAPLRVGLVCDFAEERWLSMDLMGDMLARYLPVDDFDGEFSGIQAEQLRPRLRARFSRLPLLGDRSFCRNADRLLNRFSDYPRWLGGRSGGYDVFHVVDHSYSQLIHNLPADSTVVTCHDLDTFRCVLEPERDPRPRWFRAMARRILDGFQKAAHVISVSEATRDELLRFQLFPSERITVISNGVHPSCTPQPGVSDSELSRLLAFNADSPILLSVGNTLPRKRLDILLRVFASLRRQVATVRLVRVGDLNPEQRQLARELDVLDEIVILPFLERDLLAAMYRRATLLLQTSDAEGFGLPIVEAMACGCPVVASNIPILREVGDAAAAYCSVGDVDTWSYTIAGLLTERAGRPSAWDERRQRGIARAARFSWAENARRTAEIYRSMLGERHAAVSAQ